MVTVSVGNKTSVQAAMDERLQNMTSRLTSNLIDCDGEETYPIAAYSYFIVHMKQSGNCSKFGRDSLHNEVSFMEN